MYSKTTAFANQDQEDHIHTLRNLLITPYSATIAIFWLRRPTAQTHQNQSICLVFRRGASLKILQFRNERGLLNGF